MSLVSAMVQPILVSRCSAGLRFVLPRSGYPGYRFSQKLGEKVSIHFPINQMEHRLDQHGVIIVNLRDPVDVQEYERSRQRRPAIPFLERTFAYDRTSVSGSLLKDVT